MRTTTALSRILLGVIFLMQLLAASISGKLYHDYNMNNLQDSNEPGISALTLRATDPSGSSVTSTTNNNGEFLLPTSAGQYRIEITNLPPYLNPTSVTTNASSSRYSATFFANDGSTGISIGLINPSQYTGDNPKVVAATHIAGKINSAPTIRLYNYQTSQSINDETQVDNLATFQKTGTIWGLAYNRDTKKLYSSAMLRRHAAISPDGLGAIYETDISNPNMPVTTLFTTVPNSGSVPANRNFTYTHLSHDPVYNQVGNMGLGDLDISEDNTKLYTINLNTQSLIEIDLTTKAQTVLPIPNPFGNACPNSSVKSWALKPHNGRLYIGSVCASNMSAGAAISSWDGTSFSTLISSIPLTYNRENTYTPEPQTTANWKMWNSDYHDFFTGVTTPSGRIIADAQPILTDIEFLKDRSIILAFTDRMSLLASSESYSPDLNDPIKYRRDGGGDIYKLCYVGGQYYPEGSTQCPSHNRYLDAAIPEFFTDDHHDLDNTTRLHDETSLGALAYKFGDTTIVTSSYDPTLTGGLGTLHRSGTKVLNTTTGLQSADQLLNGAGTTVGGNPGFGKAGGMGDIELVSDPAPIEIGNYVWEDLNKNGIQDAGEPPIAGVTVKLFQGTTLLGEAQTDTNGHYYFGGSQNINLSTGYTLMPQTSYRLSIALNDTALHGKTPTLANQGTDHIDSDGDNGAISPNHTSVLYTSKEGGKNNHDLDFGFKSVVDLALVKVVNTSSSPPGALRPGDQILFNIYVINQGSTTVNNIQINDYIPTGLILNDNNWVANNGIATLKTPISSIPPGESRQVDIIFTIDPNFKTDCIINNAEIASHDGDSDIDSTPNSEDGSVPDTQDDNIDNTQGMDDYDFAKICVEEPFDLALTKTIKNLPSSGKYFPGDTVVFEINVYNQEKATATNIQINDYIPAGLILDDSNWVVNHGVATLKTPIASLGQNQHTKRYIVFKIDQNFYGTTIVNNAEIASADGGTDIDSVPGSENGSTPDPLDNDTADSTGGDDYDPASIQVVQNRFDLALKKELLSRGPFSHGDNVTFKITVINQGQLHASNIVINDYLPIGLSLDDNNWYLSGKTAILKRAIPSLPAGSSTSVTIRCKIDDNIYGTTLYNNAEIASASGGADIDSVPNSENGSIPDCNNHIVSEKNGKDDYDCATVSLAIKETPPKPEPSKPCACTTQESTEITRPIQLIASENPNGTLILRWLDLSENESGYKIYLENRLIATLPANSNRFTLNNVLPNREYIFKIVSYKGSQESTPSYIVYRPKIGTIGWIIPAVYYPMMTP